MQRLALLLSLIGLVQPAELQSAVDAAMDEDRQASITRLERVLHPNSFSPGEADERGVSALALEARVALVRLYLAEGEGAAAQLAMDELLHHARERVPPVREYGAKVTQLYERRKLALERAGRATLTLTCELQCLVVIDGQLANTRSEELLLGTHQIWIKAVEREGEWEHREIELSEAGQLLVESYDDPDPPSLPEVSADLASPPDPAPRVAPERELPRAPPPKISVRTVAPLELAPVGDAHSPSRRERRLLPRGAELTAIGLGLGLSIVGAVLLSFDRTCSISSKPLTEQSTLERCGDVYDTTLGSVALLAVGGGMLLVPSVLLSVDEVRVGRAEGRELTLAVRIAF